MNRTFSLKRFGLLFKKHTIENYKVYLMSVFVLIGILTVTLLILNHDRPIPMPVKQQFALYLFFMLGAGTVFTCNTFINLGDKRRSIATLTLPASSLEKFLVGWLYSFVIFQVLYIAIFYLADVAVLNSYNWHGQQVVIMPFFTGEPVKLVYVIYAFLNATMLYGAIYFKNMHFIKTAFAAFTIVVIIWLLNDQVLGLMVGHSITNPPFLGLSFQADKSFVNVDMPIETLTWVLRLFMVITVIFWCAAYYRLKEKQV